MKRIVCATLWLILTWTLPATPTWGQVGYRGNGPTPSGTAVAPVRSQNFIVRAPDPILAQKVSQKAEQFRKELAQEWLGRELPPWPAPCPIEVILDPHAGGETSFAFVNHNAQGRGVPVDWQMKIYGPPDRLLDAVLPHEVTHTIFATHFGCPLPRWADEGACTTVEHISERKKNHQMLINFLSHKPSRGIAFNEMFQMKNYPSDILPLYAQGYSLAKFLIYQKDRRHFVDFIGQGMAYESQLPTLAAWTRAVQERYGYQDLSELQLSWQAWVRAGSQTDDVLRFAKQGGPAADATYTANASEPVAAAVPRPAGGTTATVVGHVSTSWYSQQMQNANGPRKLQRPAPTQTTVAGQALWR